MRKDSNRRNPITAGLTLVLLALLAVAGWQLRQAPAVAPVAGGAPRALAPLGAPAAPGGPVADAPVTVAGANGVVIGSAVQHDVSPPLRDIKVIPPAQVAGLREMPEPRGEEQGAAPGPPVVDPVVQRSFSAVGALTMPAPSLNFDGVNNIDGVYPPD